jgi:F0F1-type ATP synthase membrane subunit b/b'
LVGFFLVYFFVSGIFVPKIEKVLRDRDFHVKRMLQTACRSKSEADKVEKDALVVLENAQIDTAAAESELIVALREQSLREKNSLYSLFSKKSKKESDLLIKSSEEAFADINAQMNEMVKAAMKSISCSARKKL